MVQVHPDLPEGSVAERAFVTKGEKIEENLEKILPILSFGSQKTRATDPRKARGEWPSKIFNRDKLMRQQQEGREHSSIETNTAESGISAAEAPKPSGGDKPDGFLGATEQTALSARQRGPDK